MYDFCKNRYPQLLFFITVIFIISITACKKDKETVPVLNPEYSTVSDVDGNQYKTVKIGNQWWMAENLKVKCFNDSTPLFEIKANGTDSLWENQNASAFSGNSYGIFYNGYVVTSTKNIAPIGWHLPTDAEWKALEQYLGMSQEISDKNGFRGTDEAEKLMVKQTDQTSGNWSPFNTDIDGSLPYGNNESGFSAIATGNRLPNGFFTGGISDLTPSAFWWTSTTQNSNELWYRSIDGAKKNIFRHYAGKTYGFSIRCVKD